jgi:hypothetical protein
MLDQDPKQGAIDLFTTTVNGRPHMPDLLPELPPNRDDSIHGSFHDIAITSLLVSEEAQGDFSELLASVLLLQARW